MPAPISLDKTPPPAAVRIGLRFRRLLRRAGDRLLPPEVLAWERLMAFATTRVIGALVEVGAIEALGAGPATAAKLGGDLDLDADTLERTLRLAADDGIVARGRGGAWSLTATGQALREGRAAQAGVASSS